jgi:hypothetical protein
VKESFVSTIDIRGHSALCFFYGTQNALKVVINFCFWYIERNLGGEIKY